ncbi:helix-turn-helix transcriptional regulator [Actinomycetospora soli]|uniref:helix-turn-helix transcriptional regulator n=1 Tax=Actinomycetospora soli TaxID=2893887 RepID=UPI001E587DED|nr:LuxR family transcriptional regulator [Actinomycetospora soli]MCD2190588.1 LuxR C-terminal-related transcriptional regulator [Actinomycetospora soli]
MSAQTGSRTWPFVGRTDLLALADAALDADRGVLLVGPAGVGKSRAAAELLARRAAAGDTVRRALATSATADVPLGALGPLLPPWGERDGEPNLVQWAARALVARADAGSRLVLGIDDAHRLDPISAAVVGQLALTRSATVVLTARSGAPVPDALAALRRERVLERLELGALTRPEVEELVAASLGGQLDGAAAHRLWHLTRGNALYVRELVTGACRYGTLRPLDGVWVWTGDATPTQGLDDVLDDRLGALEPEELDACELLAFSEPTGPDLLASLVDPAVLDRLDRAGLVVSEQFGRRVDVRLAHPLYAELLRGRASPLRVRSVHRRLADAQAAIGARRARDRVRLLLWRLGAAQPVDPVELCEIAERVLPSDPTTAGRLADAAVEAGGGFDATFLSSRVLLAAGRADEAETLLATLEADTVDRSVRLVTTRAQNLFYALGRPDRAAAVLRAVDTGALGTDRRLTVLRAAVLAYERRYAEAWDLVAPLLVDVEAGDATTLWACVVGVTALRGRGRFDTLAELAPRGLALATALPDPAPEWQTMHLAMGEVSGHAFAGRFAESIRLSEQRYEEALDAGLTGAKIVLGGFGGLVLFLAGQVRTSARRLRDATAGVRVGSAPLVPVLRAGLAQSSALGGDPATAEAVLADLGDPDPEYAPWIHMARAWTAAVRGDLDRAVRDMTAAADAAEQRDERPLTFLMLHGLVRLGVVDDGVVDRLARQVEGVEGEYARASLAHARALAADDGDALDAVVEVFAAGGGLLLAAEVAAHAASAHRRAGRPAAERAAAARARALAGRCEGARTPALGLLDVPDDLTPREREVARLAAGGLTSRAIAERLTLSVRTVDNTLSSVYAKLHVAGRRDLATIDLGG